MTKYSLKNICLGIGIGLIISSMVNIGTAPKKLSKEEIIREAEQYNLIIVEAKDMIKKEQPEPAALQTEDKQETETLTITIEQGDTSEDIAEQLLNNKLISNKVDFLNRMKELQKESRIQTGTFKISMGLSIDNIIEIITASPK